MRSLCRCLSPSEISAAQKTARSSSKPLAPMLWIWNLRSPPFMMVRTKHSASFVSNAYARLTCNHQTKHENSKWEACGCVALLKDLLATRAVLIKMNWSHLHVCFWCCTIFLLLFGEINYDNVVFAGGAERSAERKTWLHFFSWLNTKRRHAPRRDQLEIATH